MTVDPHKNYSPLWQTPPAWVEWARATMGRIDLDPCGSPVTNDIVKAAVVIGETSVLFRTKAWHPEPEPHLDRLAGGLGNPWFGHVYCNPPGSNSVVSVRRWWAHAVEQMLIGKPGGQTTAIRSLVWCFFNYEATFSLDPSPWDLRGHMVMPQKRVRFLRDGEPVRAPRNRAWFWTTCKPAPAPMQCWHVETGT